MDIPYLFENELTPIGKFDIQGKLRVTDPCYELDVWCSGALDARHGTWHASVQTVSNAQTCGWGERNAILAVAHEQCPLSLTTKVLEDGAHNALAMRGGWAEAEFEVGVDSGTAGFFDESKYDAHRHDTENPWPLGLWADTIDDASCGECGVTSDGVVSQSGYGDGAYSCIYHTSPDDGLVDLAFIIFIGYDEDDSEAD